eukprot:TRINITY_DN4558_c0_g1_i4.p1 TRINITY_DN4558_c0_g1~~TRINITY_DN4558_c0_g1_i4.p1  ORF type:complete len:471 (-),score=119.50 TRINITY_DN4558_c0_g1_i4:432-1844(-)
MGRGKNQSGTNRHRNTEVSALDEAKKLKQQAERKPNGRERIPLLERCSQLYHSQLVLSRMPSEQQEILFDLGETYMIWSNAMKKVCSVEEYNAFNDAINRGYSLKMKHDSLLSIANICKQSVEAHKKASCIDEGDLKRESMINWANALSDLGELVCNIPESEGGGIVPGAELFCEAKNTYLKALEMDPEDVETLTNLGDCCIKQAELVYSSSGANDTCLKETKESARNSYNQAFIAYSNAYNKADVKVGDDIAGLLQNWGVGILSLAKHSPDTVEAIQAFKDAEEKLTNAAKLSLTDASIRVALGELFSEQADWHSRIFNNQTEALLFLEKANTEGYGAAVEIDATNVDALVGLGEVCLTYAKHYLQLGNIERARESSLKSLEWYNKATKCLKEDPSNKFEFSFDDQCDCLYNMACSAGLCGQYDISLRAFRHLMEIGAISPDDLLQDSDLERLKSERWFMSLTQKALAN